MQAEALSSVSPDSDFQLAPDLHPTLQGFDDGKSAASFAPQVQGPRNLVTSQALDAHHVTRNSWDPITHNLGVTSRRVSYPPATRQEFMDTHRLGIAGRSSTMPSLVHNHTDTMGWNTPSSLPASAVLSPSGAAVPTKPTGYPGQGSLPNLSPPLAFGALWIGDEQKDENLFLRGTQDEPICDLSDVSTWQRSGTGILGNGLRPSEYTPFQSTSLPSNFSSLSQLSLSQSPAFSGEPLSRHMSAAERPAAMPQTVSPGVYQAGFAINKTVDDDISPSSTPSPAPGQGPPSPPMFASRVPKSPTLTKAGRRLSASNAPYGGLSLAHKRTKSTPITGTVRTVDGRRNFSMSISTAHPSSADSESLPSASLSGQPELFGGEFGTRGV